MGNELQLVQLPVRILPKLRTIEPDNLGTEIGLQVPPDALFTSPSCCQSTSLHGAMLAAETYHHNIVAEAVNILNAIITLIKMPQQEH